MHDILVPKDEGRYYYTCVATPNAILEQCLCTLQVSFSSDTDTKLKIAVIFKGNGNRITNKEN